MSKNCSIYLAYKCMHAYVRSVLHILYLVFIYNDIDFKNLRGHVHVHVCNTLNGIHRVGGAWCMALEK